MREEKTEKVTWKHETPSEEEKKERWGSPGTLVEEADNRRGDESKHLYVGVPPGMPPAPSL